MKIFFSHSTTSNYNALFYKPIIKSNFYKKNNVILPHSNDDIFIQTKSILDKNIDLVIAEVSFPSIGLGMELGWADCYKIPIAILYKTGSKLSSSLVAVSPEFIEYKNSNDMIDKIEHFLKYFK